MVAFIAREREALGDRSPAKIGKREIARAFDIKGAGRIELKRILKELEADGAIERRRTTLHKPGVLPGVVLADFYSRDRDGDFLAAPVEWDASAGPAPKIVVGVPRRQKPGGPAPGVGDRALLRVELIPGAEQGEPSYSGRVVKILPKAKAQVLGIFRANPGGGGGGRVAPIDKKNIGQGELDVAAGYEGEARDGDLVAVEVAPGRRFGLPSARVRERLGAIDSEKAVSLIAIHAHQIPSVFSSDVLAEAERARPATMDLREDWRDVPLLTIDPADAKDHDDAVHAERDPDPENPGGFVLRIAIADVAAYVRPGTPLDRAALDRGNSVYFPDRVVPMLPERISNDLCSLRPDEDRPALAALIVIAADGRKLRHSFHRVMMRSAAKLSYPQAQSIIDAAIDGAPHETTAPLLERVLTPLYEAYAALKIARGKRAPLDLDLPERKIILNPEGAVDRVIVPPRLDAHRLIEEFMILANVAAAETLEARRQAFIYRTHDEPSIEKLHNFIEFLASIEIKFAKGQVMRSEQFNGVLVRVRGTSNEHLVNEVVLRTQAQAEYVIENYGHFGLNLKRYAHFTSPIRRYADLIVHRALIAALRLGPDGLPPMSREELSEVAARISAAERRAMAAERETVERLIAAHLVGEIGATFEGRISGATRAGLFVRLDGTGADGFIPAATLGDDYFRHDPALHALVGSRTGQMHRMGDIVSVKLVEAAPLAGALRFELLSEAPGRARRKTTGKPSPRRDSKPLASSRRQR
ncbi:ribonuclease R [Methylocapsa palsarum]|uniref:ribonuclease R n=1 Tax=Methylocapsa palsarum TaxID=1612308 RepID=UPI001FCD26DC|nr:ribonuclease R [Methylocapsa palsarum]